MHKRQAYFALILETFELFPYRDWLLREIFTYYTAYLSSKDDVSSQPL